MKKLIKKLEDLMVAVTFAEAGEFDEASRLEGSSLLKDNPAESVDALKKPSLQSAGK